MRFKEWGILGVIICLVILFSYPYHQGISPFDSGDYLKCAVNLLHGHWDITNFYSHRVGTYLPIALTIKLFGFSPQITWESENVLLYHVYKGAYHNVEIPVAATLSIIFCVQPSAITH